MLATKEELDEKRKSLQSLYTDESASKFVAYLNKERTSVDIFSSMRKDVFYGKTAISNKLLEDCKVAILRLNQIAHVLNELSYCHDASKEAQDEMKRIVRHHEDIVQCATEQLHTISKWAFVSGETNIL